MNNFHFLRPACFALVPLLFILLWFFAGRKAVSRSWQAVCDSALLPHLLMKGPAGKTGNKSLYLLAFSALLAIIALAGPVWEQLEQPVFREQSALVLILDLSRSMDASDIKPSRLTRARHKLVDILKKREEGQTALVVFAADAFIVSPLTQDSETIISQVSALKTSLMPSQGSRADIALNKAKDLLKQAGAPKGRILILTDGLENAPEGALEDAISRLTEAGHQVSVLGVGTAEGAPISLEKGGLLKDRAGKIVIPKLNESSLRRFALKGRGRYQPLTINDDDITALLSEISLNALEEQTEETGMKADLWREEGPWLLLPLLFLSALVFRRGVIASLLLMVFFSASPATALDLDGLWSRPDQRAAGVFSSGDEKAAAALFENKEWKATAHYRAGEYEESIAVLEGLEKPDALYNKGNALAKLGRNPEAMAAYDAALKIDPDHEDARHNLDLLQEQQEKQENKDQKKQEDGDPSESDDGEKSESSKGDPEDQQEQADDKNPAGDQEDQENQSESAANENDTENEDESKQATEEGQAGEDDEQQTAEADLSETDEAKQALEQWLRRIPDDPGGLLRRKFLYQSKNQQRTRNEDLAW